MVLNYSEFNIQGGKKSPLIDMKLVLIGQDVNLPVEGSIKSYLKH